MEDQSTMHENTPGLLAVFIGLMLWAVLACAILAVVAGVGFVASWAWMTASEALPRVLAWIGGAL